MEIQIRYQQEIPDLISQKIKRKLERVLKDLACPEKELSILFTDDKRIADLNNSYLGRKGPTNVLAFPMREGQASEFESPMLGNVVISVGTALRESEASGEDPLREVRWYPQDRASPLSDAPRLAPGTYDVQVTVVTASGRRSFVRQLTHSRGTKSRIDLRF